MDITPIFIWWLIITIFGVIGWPLAFSLLRHLPDRGYAFARPVGFLLCGYVLWLGGSFRLLQNNLGGVALAMTLMLLLGWFWRRQQRQAGDALTMAAWLRREWRYVVSIEILFHVAFIGWTIYRAYNPNIETAGGEKWMEIAFINGTLRSDYFPPQDPWLSGFGISYYYFGYVLMAMATRLSGLISTIAFNLYIPTLFGMTLTAAFGLVANLVSLHQNQTSTIDDQQPPVSNQSPISNLPIFQSPLPVLTGLIAALFVGIMGNLQGLLEVLHKRGFTLADFWAWEVLHTWGLLPASFWGWLDIRDINKMPEGPQSWIPDRFIWWWRGSRVLTDYTLTGQQQEVIDEFPFFSFLLGDVHPHVLALPFVLLAVGLALNLLANRRTTLQRLPRNIPAENEEPPLGNLFDKGREVLLESWRNLLEACGGRLAFVIYAVGIGGLSFLNTWDFPIYLSVVGLAFIAWLLQREQDWSFVIPTGIVGTAILGLLSIILYLPFYATFQSQAGGVLPNLWNPTRLPQFFVFFGPFLVAVITLLIVLAGQHQGWLRHIGWTLPLTILGPVLVMILVLGTALISPAGRSYIQGILNDPNVQATIGSGNINDLIWESVQRRGDHPATFLLLGSMIGLALATVVGYYHSSAIDEEDSAATSPRLTESFVLILLLVGLGLPLAVEFVYLRDNFGIRMNTVFKFYFQAWVLLALASAFAVYYVSISLWAIPRIAWQGMMAVLVAAAMIYPVLATANKANYFRNEPTLNGIQWVSQHRPGDYAAIQWLRENAEADTVILEAPGSGYAAYQYTSRVSALTGLPTLLGWGGHQSQWRGNYDEPGRREPDIETLFNSQDLRQTQMLLDKYNIDYVYIGPLERERYNPQGLQKFEQLMEVVFQQDDVVIYGRG